MRRDFALVISFCIAAQVTIFCVGNSIVPGGGRQLPGSSSPGSGIADDSSLVWFFTPETGLRRPAHLQQGHLTIFKRICHHTAME